ncbi:FAD-binding and (Fe-S)-binding domain-containing protein [Chitinimonas sp. BJYL2]|uniref:FAD-binding and (Fe-S)-binding domain-containing protein n=1 Tax=Chitinimonas sp. BJYL2 TaxID=2976696 RepID=UPI0022B516CB|nr:FAD-binding and (Fe-S)-binding domain-containing protein [Chitinimonas sp. BJYL2]
MDHTDAITAFAADLAGHVPAARCYTDAMARLAYGTDASFYRLIPAMVVKVESEAEVAAVLAAARAHRVGITFRAAGTSLSGQAVTDSVLVLLGDGWHAGEILDGGERIRLLPGVIGQQANDWLRPFARKIGPDPASINTCKIGGIAANNASGMCCGTRDNSYHTLAAIRVMLADGAILDTADASSVAAFRHSHADLLARLAALAAQVRANTALCERIRHKYRLKNTTGYGINALVDFDDPVDILSHLMIGSEGTLGFIAAITYRTVPDHPHKASALVFWDALDACCDAVSALAHAPVSAVELMDGLSLQAVAKQLPTVLGDRHFAAGLLIETRAPDAATLEQQVAAIEACLAPFAAARHTGFSTDTATIDTYWSVRKGLFPAVGAVRETGSTVVIEDVTFPVARLAAGVAGLRALFAQLGYDEALLFGHALEGNLHMVFTPRFDDPAEVARYDALMQGLVQLVAVEFGGSLKGEHGTGRNMAPFVRTEWGDEAYAVMQAIKALFDPAGILNPGVLLNADPHLHLQNLKPMPAADPIVDKCIECGFCEPACPAHGYTLSPRQRIVVWREIQAMGARQDQTTRKRWLRQYRHHGIDSCAATGMCATRCPVGINTGTLMKQLAKAHDGKLANWGQRHYRLASSAARQGLYLWHGLRRLLGEPVLTAINREARRVFPLIPLVPSALKAGTTPALAPHDEGRPVVLFPSCVNRVLAGADGQRSELVATLSLLAKAGFAPVYPPDTESLCCGQPFASKNAHSAADAALAATNAALLTASAQGRHPVYLDNGPCSLRLLTAQRAGQLDARLQLHAGPAFLRDHVLPRLHIQRVARLALHVPCSASLSDGGHALRMLAAATAEEVVESGIACCGFAGDKGLTQPALNAHALRDLRQRQQGCDAAASSSRTCQIGLQTHTGLPYQSIEALLDAQSMKTP